MSELAKENKLKFAKESHQYFLNNMELPSVTTLIGKILGNKYEGVDEEVLKKASEHGTKVHKLIEEFEKGKIANYLLLNEREIDNLEEYKRIKGFDTLKTEFMVHYKDLYAGTIDGIGVDDENNQIIYDIKTTSEVDFDYVCYQLSLYLLAYDEKNYDNYTAYILHFPKNKRAKKVMVELLDREELNGVIGKIKELKKGV